MFFFREEFGSVLMERIASEFNKLQYSVSQTGNHPLVEQIKPVSQHRCKAAVQRYTVVNCMCNTTFRDLFLLLLPLSSLFISPLFPSLGLPPLLLLPLFSSPALCLCSPPFSSSFPTSPLLSPHISPPLFSPLSSLSCPPHSPPLPILLSSLSCSPHSSPLPLLLSALFSSPSPPPYLLSLPSLHPAYCHHHCHPAKQP